MKRLVLALVLVFSVTSAWAQEPSEQSVEVTTATVTKTASGEAKAKVVFSTQRPQNTDELGDEPMGVDDMDQAQ